MIRGSGNGKGQEISSALDEDPEIFKHLRLRVCCADSESFCKSVRHERSALPPPLDPPPAYSSNPLALARLLVDRALALIPPPFRPTHVHQSVPLEITPGCFRDFVQFRTLTLEAEGHPNYYGLVPTVAASVPRTISLLSFRSDLTFPNVCSCSNLQSLPLPTAPSSSAPAALTMGTSLHSCLLPHSPIHVGDPPTNESDFVLHFDGDAFRDKTVGGAGTVLWLHSHGCLLHLASPCSHVPMQPTLKQQVLHMRSSLQHSTFPLTPLAKLSLKATIAQLSTS